MSNQSTDDMNQPNCPKCRRKVYDRLGVHDNTMRVASADPDKNHDRKTTRWVEFNCGRCSIRFAVPDDVLTTEIDQ